MQFDYMKWYFDMIYGYPKFVISQSIVKKYLDYPILNWRNLFV